MKKNGQSIPVVLIIPVWLTPLAVRIQVASGFAVVRGRLRKGYVEKRGAAL
jgi:hypothetical protein